ncbi:hypothetical protein O9992_30090 [Vibrio lentus]|nr:hypothetical protein [Vibrio lentus]
MTYTALNSLAGLYRDSGDYSPRPDMSGGANEGLSNDILIPTDYDRDTITAKL